MAVRNQKNQKKSTFFIIQIFNACSFLDGHSGIIDNAEAVSETNSVKDVNEKVSNRSDGSEDSHDGYNDHESVINDEEDQQKCDGLSDQISNNGSESNVQGENRSSQRKNLFNQAFPRHNNKTNSVNKFDIPSLTSSLKKLEDLVQKNKFTDRFRSRTLIICRFLDDLSKAKQPGYLRKILKTLKKYAK